jgi:peptidoglycan/xylan/chitin deacetylase (PgdA/CDA1 family)
MSRVHIDARNGRRPSQAVQAWLVVIVVSTLVACAFWFGTRMARVSAQVGVTQASERVVYLTFDDGPSADYTSQVLADLDAVGAHATFFEIGINMRGNCPLMRQMLADGNQLGSHSWDHPLFPKLTQAQTVQEISAARALQVSCTGHDSRLFRYPYNQPSESGSLYLGQQDMISVDSGINVEDWDWKHVSDAQVITRVMAQVHPGAIIQLHDGTNVLGRDGGHPGYLPGLLRDLRKQGYVMLTLPGQGDVNGGD